METDIGASRGLGKGNYSNAKQAPPSFWEQHPSHCGQPLRNFPCSCLFFLVSVLCYPGLKSWGLISFVTASKGDREHVRSADMPVQNRSYPLASQFLFFQKQPFWMLTELLFRKSISTGVYTSEEGHWSVGRFRKHFSLCIPSKKTYPWSVRLVSWTIIRKWVYLKKGPPKVLSVKMLSKSI